MFKNLKKQPIVLWTRSVSLACQIALMPKGQFAAMLGHLEANALGGLERARYFQEVAALAKACRTRGPLALFMKRANLVKSLRNAYVSSLVFSQLERL
jgi:hypothetical protein